MDDLHILAKSRCEDILNADLENFDPGFIQDMLDKLERGIVLTDRQLVAIKNIHDRWLQ